MNDNTESLWRCRICGSGALLSESHAHCPNCSHERDWEEVELPGWDELASRADHRFTGTAFYCCDVGWSSQARYCGCCAERLVHTAPRLRVVPPLPEEDFPEIEVTLADLVCDDDVEPTPQMALVPFATSEFVCQGA